MLIQLFENVLNLQQSFFYIFRSDQHSHKIYTSECLLNVKNPSYGTVQQHHKPQPQKPSSYHWIWNWNRFCQTGCTAMLLLQRLAAIWWKAATSLLSNSLTGQHNKEGTWVNAEDLQWTLHSLSFLLMLLLEELLLSWPVKYWRSTITQLHSRLRKGPRSVINTS